MADRDKYVYMAKLAEQAEKYDGEDISIITLRPNGLA